MIDQEIHHQNSRYSSPWDWQYRLRILLWEYSWALLCSWTPKPFNPWRLAILRLFGTKIHGCPFVHQRAYIEHPWNLTLHDRACLGDQTHAYCLGKIVIKEGACVAQEAYLCTGTHDFSDPVWPLKTATIEVGDGAFIGARAFILPGIKIGRRAVVGACSVVTKDVPQDVIVKGNPASAKNRTGN
jgi:putative colanic acid biosynthesis acetyltransferase WcaF